MFNLNNQYLKTKPLVNIRSLPLGLPINAIVQLAVDTMIPMTGGSLRNHALVRGDPSVWGPGWKSGSKNQRQGNRPSQGVGGHGTVLVRTSLRVVLQNLVRSKPTHPFSVDLGWLRGDPIYKKVASDGTVFSSNGSSGRCHILVYFFRPFERPSS